MYDDGKNQMPYIWSKKRQNIFCWKIIENLKPNKPQKNYMGKTKIWDRELTGGNVFIVCTYNKKGEESLCERAKEAIARGERREKIVVCTVLSLSWRRRRKPEDMLTDNEWFLERENWQVFVFLCGVDEIEREKMGGLYCLVRLRVLIKEEQVLYRFRERERESTSDNEFWYVGASL